MRAKKKSLGIVFAVAIVSLLIKFPGLAQERELWSGQDLLRKLKFVHVPGALPAPRFNAPTPEGTKIGNDDLKGKLVLLNFWATWCPPCILEMPTMEKLHRELKGEGLAVVAMDFMEGPETIKAFIKKRGFTFTVLMDRSGEISQRYGVHALPVTFLIGRQGNMLVKSIGYKDWYKKEIGRRSVQKATDPPLGFTDRSILIHKFIRSSHGVGRSTGLFQREMRAAKMETTTPRGYMSRLNMTLIGRASGSGQSSAQ